MSPPLTPPLAPQRDPIVWCILLSLGFAALAGWHLGIPSKIYFDEVHYVPAARAMLQGMPANLEHPLVGKEAIAAAIALGGDRPVIWRIPSLVFGTLGLFAFGRALWWASGRRFAALAGMLLLASDFAWFVQSRIAMLDMVMAGLGMVALWMLASALRLPEGTMPRQRRWRLALGGLCLGLALGAKWSIAPVALLVSGGLILWRLLAAGRRCLKTSDALPFPGLSLVELVFWLCSLPLIAYWASFLPGFFYHKDAISPFDPVSWHRYMLDLQASVVKHHPYQTVWWQWVVDWRGVWYLYEVVDGAQRGIVLIGNPFTMLLGLQSLVWCLWAGLWRRRGEALVVLACYAASLDMWIVARKPVQFYYHYLLPGSFLMAALALQLDALWHARGRWHRHGRWLAAAIVAVSLGIFAWFYPIIAAAPLHHGTMSFDYWMWLPSWA